MSMECVLPMSGEFRLEVAIDVPNVNTAVRRTAGDVFAIGTERTARPITAQFEIVITAKRGKRG